MNDTDTCTAACTLAACGDGFLQLGNMEQCDDGMMNSDQGDCTSTCKSNVCGDGLINMQGMTPEECDLGMANGPGQACNGMCKTNVCGDGDPGPNEQCDDGNMVKGDGCSDTCTLEVCGNNAVDGAEQCDDGKNGNQDDGCTDKCLLPFCGDAFVQASKMEACDNGALNSDTSACTLSCKKAICGDGLVWTGQEQCDDGNVINNDACSNTCKKAICGDMIVQAPETCDDGNKIDNDNCTNACKSAKCGDGIVQMAQGEECDLGAMNSNTGTCTTFCKKPKCGDGFLQGSNNEVCDDGNAVNTDACILCKAAKCGDNFIQAGVEQCDDGNVANNDLCNDNCTKPKRVFVTSTAWNGNLGGVAGAKAKCQARANALNLGGTWDAWVSNNTSTPSSRFIKSITRYARLDGLEVAQTWGDLTDGSIDVPININELKAMVGQADVWTGTSSNGTSLEEDCSGWTAGGGFGVIGYEGRNNATNADWTNTGLFAASNCSTVQRLYCFEQ
jgi:cysteine-rich repeat protein